MTPTFKAYFRAHFRSKIKLLLCLLIFALALTSISAFDGQKSEYSYYDRDDVLVHHVYYYTNLGLQVFILCALAYILPVLEFSLFKKRKNLDCFYALPVSRKAMGMVHYFTGLILLIVPFTFSYLLNFLMMLRYPEGFYYPPLLGLYFLSLLMATVIYTVFTFLFNQANSTGDGIWFIVLWSFILGFAVEAVNTVLWAWPAGMSHTDLGIPWFVLMELEWVYSAVIEKSQNADLSVFWMDLECYAWFVIWIFLGIGSAVGFVLSFGRRRAEKTQEISDSWFGYKLLIPVFAVAAMICWYDLAALIALIMAFVGYIIYRKGFRLKKWDWIILGILTVIAIICILDISFAF